MTVGRSASWTLRALDLRDSKHQSHELAARVDLGFDPMSRLDHVALTGSHGDPATPTSVLDRVGASFQKYALVF